MSVQYTLGNGNLVTTGKSLGMGGEGHVYKIDGSSEKIVKIYKKEIDQHKRLKVVAMIDLKNEDIEKITAWPIDCVRNSRNEICGFVMRLANGRPVHELYNPKSRKKYFSNANFKFCIRVALNISKAFAILHKNGVIVADVNHSGIMVDMNATVKIIDCDSFQIEKNGLSFYCDVGVEEYTAPDLQGMNLRGLQRKQHHDLFGLSVLLFQLLMNGRHPFSGKSLDGTPDRSPGEKIKDNRYAYSVNKSKTKTERPPKTPLPSVWGAKISAMFEASFLGQAELRPSAAAWVVALEELEKNIISCPKDINHFFEKNQKCGWCESAHLTSFLVETEYNTDNILQLQHAQADLNHDIQRIVNLNLDPALQILRPAPSMHAKKISSLHRQWALKKRQIKARAIKNSIVWGVVSLFLITIFSESAYKNIMPKNAADSLWILSFIFAVIIYISREKPPPPDNQIKQLNSNLDFVIKELLSYKAMMSNMTNKRNNILLKNKEFIDTADMYKKYLTPNSFADYMRNSKIDEANIKLINRDNKRDLARYNILTAADIDSGKIIKIRGFGVSKTAAMLAWRNSTKLLFEKNRDEFLNRYQNNLKKQNFDQKNNIINECLSKYKEVKGMCYNFNSEYSELYKKIHDSTQKKLELTVDYEEIKTSVAMSLLE